MAPAPDPEKLKLGEVETVTIRGPDFKLELPLTDHARRMYPKSSIVFKLPTTPDKARIVSSLQGAIERLVVRIPWLACELKPNPEANGIVKGLASGMISKSSWVPSAFKASPEQALKAKIHHVIIPGPALLYIRRENPGIVYTKMTATDCGDELFPALPIKDEKTGAETWPALGVQAVFTADGYLVLSFAIHHALADGRSHMDIIKLLSEEFRQVSAGNTGEKATLIPGILDRSRIASLMPNGPVSKATENAHPAMKIWGATEVMGLIVKMQRQNSKQTNLDRRYLFSRAALTALLPASNPLGVSPHDLACALLWRGTMVARLAQGKISQKGEVGFGMSVCIRRHMPDSKSKPFYGNAFSAIEVHMPLSKLLASDGILAGALVIRKGIIGCDLDDSRVLAALHVSASDLRLVQSKEIGNLGTSFVFLTSWNSFPSWNFNWGPLIGTYKGVQMPAGGRPDGLMVMLSPPESGDFSVAVELEDKSFEVLDKDQTWNTYARPEEMVY